MVATEDQMIPPQAEEFMAKRMGATVRKVPASHAAMVSHPKEVAELITSAAESKSGQLTAAENLWQKTFDLNEDIDELGINLALAECMLGNKNAAQRVLQRVLLYSPDRQIARRKLQAIQSGQETCAAPASAF